MKWILHVGGLPFDGGTLREGNSLGGSETAAYYLARELVKAGEDVIVYTNGAREGTWEGVVYKYMGAVSEQFPLGEAFEKFARGHYFDVLLGQRHPYMFASPFGAEVNIWWTHDLAITSTTPHVMRSMWNVDKVAVVSKWHAEQVEKVYGIPAKHIHVLRNGVDGGLFQNIDPAVKRASKRILYTSRPERGLQRFLDVAKAMENSGLEFAFSWYNHVVPEMEPLYNALMERASTIKSVRYLGHLGKEVLANEMKGAWLHLYPSDFEEVSCITAMEEQWAGTPFLATRTAALPETLEDAGVYWLRDSSVETSVAAIKRLQKEPQLWDKLHAKALAKREQYNWADPAKELIKEATNLRSAKRTNPSRVARHLMQMSDIVPLKKLLDNAANDDGIMEDTRAEYAECYRFLDDGIETYYDKVYDHEHEKAVDHTWWDARREPRFNVTASMLRNVPAGGRILDYGCAHGHYTVGLAKAYPEATFLGIDLVQRNIDEAREMAKEQGVDGRCEFRIGTTPPEELFDAIVAGEILEHVPDWPSLAAKLLKQLKPGGVLVGTTPYGPWEAWGFVDEWPWRNHLHHISPDDLSRVFGNSLVRVEIVPYPSFPGNLIGSYVFVVEPQGEIALGEPDYNPFNRMGAPADTLSVCMIVRSDGMALAKTLQSISYAADEIIVGITDSKGGPAWDICKRFRAKAFQTESPLDIGFAAARNKTIEKASGDWILWIDDDETLTWPRNLRKYLRQSMFTAYAIPHHHLAVEPLGLIKTDMPTRLFRNKLGIRFFGEVHEHPEFALNKGIGMVYPLGDVAIAHGGYDTEQTRRERFQRNLALMIRDREVNPDRELGKFLWVRDLAQINRFEFERTRFITPEMQQRAVQAIELWREMLLKGKNLRLSLDGLPYYSECVNLLYNRNAIAAEISLRINAKGLGDDMTPGHAQPIPGLFAERADLAALLQLMAEAKTQHLGSKY